LELARDAIEYSRNTKSIAINMIYGLVQKAKKGWVPGLPRGQDVRVEDEEEAEVIQLFVKVNVKIKAEGLRYHVLGLKDPTVSACGKVKAKDLEPAGHVPSSDLICGTHLPQAQTGLVLLRWENEGQYEKLMKTSSVKALEQTEIALSFKSLFSPFFM